MKRISAFCLIFHGDPRILSLMSLPLPNLREQEQQPAVLIFFFPDLFLIICVHVCVSVCVWGGMYMCMPLESKRDSLGPGITGHYEPPCIGAGS